MVIKLVNDFCNDENNRSDRRAINDQYNGDGDGWNKKIKIIAVIAV